jgi:hypothetical protein
VTHTDSASYADLGHAVAASLDSGAYDDKSTSYAQRLLAAENIAQDHNKWRAYEGGDRIACGDYSKVVATFWIAYRIKELEFKLRYSS